MKSAAPSSRERMLAALDCREPEQAPCSFMLFNALRDTCRSYEEFVLRQVELGLDAYVQLPPRPPVVVNDHYNLHGLPVSYDPRVEIAEWIEHPVDEEWPVMVKEYRTPAGKLRAEVRQTPDWPWGEHVPFLDDYIVPRARKFLVTGAEDLPVLRCLLQPPSLAEMAAYREEAGSTLELARRHDLLVAGGWGVGADLIGRSSGSKTCSTCPTTGRSSCAISWRSSPPGTASACAPCSRAQGARSTCISSGRGTRTATSGRRLPGASGCCRQG